MGLVEDLLLKITNPVQHTIETNCYHINVNICNFVGVRYKTVAVKENTTTELMLQSAERKMCFDEIVVSFFGVHLTENFCAVV